MRSAGTRYFIVGFLALLMFIPLFFAGVVINDRGALARSTASSLGREWGGAQVLSGPELVVPVTRSVKRSVREPVIDPITGLQRVNENGEGLTIVVERVRDDDSEALHILPERLDMDLKTLGEVRRRGLFKVPVYRATANATFHFDVSDIALNDRDKIHWERARVVFGITSNRALRGETVLTADGEVLRVEPWEEGYSGGLSADVGDPRKIEGFTLDLGFQGAGGLHVAPVGRTTSVKMDSDWPHPSFNGAFLPDQSELREDGFSASWTIPHLARPLPSVSRSSQIARAEDSTFGLRFFQPNDFYQKAYRAARYGIMFIALTFLSVLLIEGRREKPTHPVQYIFIGLAQSMFVVLMVAYAEQIGFGAAYALASAATVGLITTYGWVGLRLGKRAWLLGAVLAALYGLLFLILRSTDHALLAGATVLFLALAGTMFGTRNEDWYGPENGRRWFGRAKPHEAS